MQKTLFFSYNFPFFIWFIPPADIIEIKSTPVFNPVWVQYQVKQINNTERRETVPQNFFVRFVFCFSPSLRPFFCEVAFCYNGKISRIYYILRNCVFYILVNIMNCTRIKIRHSTNHKQKFRIPQYRNTQIIKWLSTVLVSTFITSKIIIDIHIIILSYILLHLNKWHRASANEVKIKWDRVRCFLKIFF